MRIRLTCIIVFLLLLPAAAQDAPADEPTAFMRALSLIPAETFVIEAGPILSFGDYHASLEARGLSVPEDFAALEASEVDGPILFGLANAGPSDLLQSLMQGGSEYETTVGFDFFDVEQGIEIGVPPAAGQILLGDFDPAKIIAAYTLRGYTAETRETGTLLCPADGCDSGTKTNFNQINPSNPFGGRLGRSEPAFIGDGVFLNSPNIDVLNAMIATYEGSAPSLAEIPEFQAIATTLASYPSVSVVTVFNPIEFGTLDVLGATASPEAIERLMETVAEPPLPLYKLVAVASTSDDDAQYGLTLVVYEDGDSAAAAAEVIDSRMSLNSMRTATPYAEVYGVAGTLEPTALVADEATGLTVAVVRITGEIPPNEPADGRVVMSHIPYSRFITSVYSRDALWLVWAAE